MILDIWIDDIVPCLKETATGDLKQTVVFKIQSRSYMKDFNTKNGWHINWSRIPNDVEVYALAIRGSNEIQGLIGVKNDPNAKTAYIFYVSKGSSCGQRASIHSHEFDFMY